MGMNRRKELPPDIFTDERLAVLPHEVRLTAIGLRANADNWGRESANPSLVKAALWALWPRVTVAKVQAWLEVLQEVRYIVLYEDDGRAVYQIVDWPRMSHQGDGAARFPPPPSGVFPESFPAGEREGESERERESEGGGVPESPPSRYCPSHRPNGTYKNCKSCATQRERFERWQDEQMERANGRAEGSEDR